MGWTLCGAQPAGSCHVRWHLSVVLSVVLTVRVRENILIIRPNTINALPLISIPAKMSLMKLAGMVVGGGSSDNSAPHLHLHLHHPNITFSLLKACQPSQDHNQQKRPLILPGPKEVSFRKRKGEGVMGPGVNFTNLAKYKAADLGIIYGFCRAWLVTFPATYLPNSHQSITQSSQTRAGQKE